MRKTPSPAPCGPQSPRLGPLDTFERLVHDYATRYQPHAEQEMQWYASQPSLGHAVEVAARSELPSGKRHPHQRRIPASVLERVEERLLAANLGRCETFHDLFEAVQQAAGGIRGAGELLVYDVAHRIGAYLGLEPERVYLHAGTRAGARALGLDEGQGYLEPEDLPGPFRRLTPAEVEDCLCIYKSDLLRLSG